VAEEQMNAYSLHAVAQEKFYHANDQGTISCYSYPLPGLAGQNETVLQPQKKHTHTHARNTHTHTHTL